MKNLIIIAFLSLGLFFIFNFGVFAQETSVQDSGFTPDSPFYFFKIWKESIQTFFTFGAENKAEQFLHLAEIRLAEYQEMIEKEKTEIAERTLEKYEKQLNQALKKAEEAKEKGKDVVKLKEEIGEKILKHQEVLARVLEKKAEETKVRIEEKAEITAKPKPISSVPPKPSISSESIPTEIRYFTCPDGVKVESGKCYGTGEKFYCSILSSPELQCVAPTPPVPKGGVCSTAGETKYYTCSDGAKATWCVCGPESGAIGTKNVWRCQHLPQLACPKPVPAPASQPVACYIQKDCVFVENKDDCLKKGGSPSSESSCPAPAPAPVPLACTVSGIKDYKCPDGTSIKWQCSCGEDSWSCQTNPAIFCPGLRDTTSLIISDIWIRDIFWTEEPPVPNVTQGPGLFHFFWGTNKPATSYVEYGLSDSYGLTTPTPPSSLGIQHTNNAQTKLKGNTLYHSRIVATDAQGNTAVSGDFTFFPAFNFTTIPGTVQPYIRLSSPGISPTHWKIGQTPSIVWEARGVNKVNIDLVMFDSSGNRLKTYSIAKDVSSSGTAGGSYIYTWKVLSNSEFLQAGYKFKVVISDPAAFVFGTNANDLFIEE